MDKERFSTVILRCSYHHWRYVLVGQRNLSFKKAQVAAQVLVTPVEVWLDSERADERQAAWENFSNWR